MLNAKKAPVRGMAGLIIAFSVIALVIGTVFVCKIQNTCYTKTVSQSIRCKHKINFFGNADVIK